MSVPTSPAHPEHDQLTHLRRSKRPKGKRQTEYFSKRLKAKGRGKQGSAVGANLKVGFQELGIRRKKKAVEQATERTRKGNHLIHSKKSCDCWKFEKA